MSDPTTIWITTEPDVEGVYQPVVILGKDRSYSLAGEAGQRYAGHVIGAAAIAEHEAAIAAQIAKMTSPDHALLTLKDFRARRLRPVTSGTALELVPGVSLYTGEPFLGVEIDGRRVGQWTVADARGHAQHALTAVVVAELDQAYLYVLTDDVDLPEPAARAAVAALAEFKRSSP
jgi:hypothetical protein